MINAILNENEEGVHRDNDVTVQNPPASSEQDPLVHPHPNVVSQNEVEISDQKNNFPVVECALPLLEESNQIPTPKDRKNTNLRLNTDSSIKKEEDKNPDLSPCNNVENILLDYEWVSCVKPEVGALVT